MLKRILSFNWIITYLCIAGCLSATYYILLNHTPAHISIASILNWSHLFARDNHLLVLGFLPIYISIMIFGACGIGILLSKAVQKYIRGNQK